ncbi:MAG: PAS domain-containing sensor histidine kinase [Chloroflexi bacterium]|nr:PAS domain-containing sensor histidine kinase [Chloroflexota bacterium]
MGHQRAALEQQRRPPPVIGSRRRGYDRQRRGERIERLLHTLDAVPFYATYVDVQQCYRFANRAYSLRFDRPPHALAGRTVREVVGEASYAVMGPYIARTLAGEHLRYERLIHDPDGTACWIESHYLPDRRDDGRIVGFVALIFDITERKLAADERERLLLRERTALSEARAALSVRDQFLSSAAHELRTPLTTIKGYVQYLARLTSESDAERQRQFIGHLQRQISRFERLVADLLDVARLQQGRLELRLESIDIVDLVRQAVARAPLLPEHLPTHELALDAPPMLIGRGDPDRLDQVLTNVLSNALKYSPDGGTVRVIVRALGETAEVTIVDEGVGVDDSELVDLFQPFARGAAVRGRFSGLGLGLYISAQIMEQHRGTLSLQCALHRGCIATIRLPLP